MIYGLDTPQVPPGDAVVRSVLIPVTKIVEEVPLRVVVLDQVELVVVVVGGLALYARELGSGRHRRRCQWGRCFPCHRAGSWGVRRPKTSRGACGGPGRCRLPWAVRVRVGPPGPGSGPSPSRESAPGQPPADPVRVPRPAPPPG